MNQNTIASLQARITAALSESPNERPSYYSDYLPSPRDAYLQNFAEAAASGGVEGMSNVLDEFDRLAATADLRALRSALMLFLTHHSVPQELGLRIPSVLQRRGRLIAAAKRKKSERKVSTDSKPDT